MTIHGLVDKLTQLFYRLCYSHQWQGWEVLTAAGAAVLLLVIIWTARKRRDEKRAATRVQMIHQSPSIIGARLAARSQSLADAADVKRRRLPFIAGRNGGQVCAAESAAALGRDAGLLQQQTATRQQTEASLQRQLDELQSINEKLQSQNNHCKQTEDRLRRRMAKLMAAGKKLRQQRCRPEQTEETLRKQPRWSPLEILAPGRIYRNSRNAQGPGEETLTVDSHRTADSRRSREPLDVEKLKAIAALARRIQSRPRRA